MTRSSSWEGHARFTTGSWSLYLSFNEEDIVVFLCYKVLNDFYDVSKCHVYRKITNEKKYLDFNFGSDKDLKGIFVNRNVTLKGKDHLKLRLQSSSLYYSVWFCLLFVSRFKTSESEFNEFEPRLKNWF